MLTKSLLIPMPITNLFFSVCGEIKKRKWERISIE
jgi:hypothetical protein